MSSSILKNALECLEDTFTSPVLRQNKYQEVLHGLKTSEAIDEDTATRLIAVCIKDFNKDTKYATNASTVIGSLLTKIKKGQCSPPPNLALSAISVINLLKTIAFGKFDALKGILFNTLLSYPENTLICVITENSDSVIGFLSAYVSASNRVVPITFLTTLLKILPSANKISFVKEALALWFTKVIPFAMGSIQADFLVTPCIELLEQLTEVLVDIDYTENPHWIVLLECFYNPKKYPAIIKSMLNNNSDVWHRVWIIYIKLLKSQITKISNSTGSPINSLLPVVEAAFKMDTQNRCRAFQCWSVLIDNFSSDSNEAYVLKRLNLLLLPLKSNNAKLEVIAISKFNTWWHLIGAYHCRMESLTEMILMPFIHFCFGKTATPVAPGQFSDTLKELSLQALVEIFGHVNCEGCVNIPKLKIRLINTKILVDHWNDWIHCFKAAVATALGSNSEQIMQQITCIWKSLVMTIAELPENNIRKDMFNELLELISIFMQRCQENTKLADIVMNILIKSLFEDDNKISSLLVTKKTGPMYVLLPMLSNSFVEEFYKGKSMDEVLSFFKPVTTFMMNEILCCPNRIITWLLKSLPRHGNCVVFWIALVDAVCESKQDLAEETLDSILSYPLQKFDEYSNEMCTVAAYKWFTTYNTLRHKIGKANFDKQTLKIFSEQTERDCLASQVFMLHVSLAIVKRNLLQNIDGDPEYVTQIFLNSLSSIDAYSSIEKVFPALIDTLNLMSTKLKDCINLQLAKFYVSTLKLTMKLLLQQTLNDTTIIFAEKMLLSLLDIVTLKEYQDLVLTIKDEILACSSIEKTHAFKISCPLSTLTSFLSDKKNTKSSVLNEQKERDTINNEIATNEGNIKKVPDISNAKKDMKSSILPNTNTFCKKSNKRAASILKTVVENGEKFVVVKSNWKFNPRNLTEKQKEKLKRKREDIPALYQDLSQSQDECSLRAWRTESQDATTTSTTSSKSASKSNKKDATTILSQIPNTDVVPRIFENILADSTKNNVNDKSNGDNSIVNNNNLSVDKQSTSAKDTMSPRLALKDRVFRNVRNLIERSSLPKDTLLSTEDKTLNENTAKTPANKANIFMNANSAPPKIVSERPSRVIKIPKKFDDSEITSLKKKRYSQDLRADALEINNLKKRVPSQDSRSDNLKNSQHSLDSQLKDAETIGIKTKQTQDTRPDASKIRSLKKSRQLVVPLETVTSDITTVTNTEQLLSVRSDGETTDLKTKQQPQDSRLGASKISRSKNRQLSQYSQSDPSETFTLTNSQQLQESEPDASKIQQQSVHLDSVTSDVITVTNSRKSQDSQSDDKTTDLKTKQSPNSRLDASKISRSRNEQLSQDSQSVPSETVSLTNGQHLQESLPYAAKISSLRRRRRQSQEAKSVAPDTSSFKKRPQSQDSPLNSLNESKSESTDVLDLPNKAVKGANVQKECNEKVSDKNDVTEFSNCDIQYTQNHSISAKVEKQFAITVQDVLADSQPTDIIPIQDTGPVSEPITDSVTVRDTLPDSQDPKEQSTNNDRQDTQNHNILADSQPKEQSNSFTLQDILLPDSHTIEESTNSVPLVELNKGKNFMDEDNSTKEIPKLAKTHEQDIKEKSLSAKKQKSRLKESNKLLLIDMVQGHPGITESKRLRTKHLIGTTNIKKKPQPLSEKREKKSGLQIVSLPKSATKASKKQKDKTNVISKETVKTLNVSQENQSHENTSISLDDQLLTMSEDFIESSQDSMTISVKSSKSILKNRPLCVIDKIILPETFSDGIISLSDTSSSDQEDKEDSLFPKNITVENSALDLTENMNTQPVDDQESSGDVMFVTNEQSPIVINTENTLREPNTQETAEADTEPMNVEVTKTSTSNSETESRVICNADNREKTTKPTFEALESLDPVEQTYSPSKDEPERNKDFLNNTQEISPIKTLSPLREKQSSSPETSRDYVVIKLTSPVHSNGEPFEKCDSPEIFTEDKISPDKRNESPPRVEVIVNTSPSSSLSLKKNRPQIRAGGRAAQMLDLCAIMNKDNSTDATDTRRNTPAKRNLKYLYNSSEEDVSENTATKSESAEIEHFLEFKKSLPSTNSSPAGPILKRKFTEITDETTSSPANKRKRVSFHDPPVSTTVAVQKYIEPGAIHSPQHSTIKRRDRPVRNHATMKSPKRLESVFKLENVLSKAVESFTEDAVVDSIGDTEMSSIEQTPTPALDIVKPGDLNDTEPICIALLGCNDPIENIAAELSSPAMKSLFIKEMEGKVGTIAELAKMTEIEINRLCIKAPKVQVAKKVLLDYAFKKLSTDTKQDNLENVSLVAQKQVEIVHLDAQTQTSETERSHCEMQTDPTSVAYMQTQTDCMQVAHTSAQTDESGHTSTKDVIASCLSERPDFVAQLSEHLDASSVQMIADNALSFDDVLELLSKKMTIPNSVEVMNKVLEAQSKSDLSCNSTQNKLAFIQDYLSYKFDSNELFNIGIQLVQKAYKHKPT